MARRVIARALALLVCSWTFAHHVKVVFVPLIRPSASQSLIRLAGQSRVRRNFFGQGGPPELVEAVAPTWDELRSKLEGMQTPQEIAFRKELAEGRGPPNAMANLRVFDKDASDAQKVTLYRDSASWCPYCQKVWVLLEEKQIPYTVKRINMNCYGDKPKEFLALQPNGCIPVVVMGGNVMGSSDEIIGILLKIPGSSPAVDRDLDPSDDPRSNILFSLDRQLGGAWLGWVRGGGDSGRFTTLLQKVEDALSADTSGPYFLGDRFSVIDIMYTPYFERAVASLAYFKGFNIRDRSKYPAINAWLDALETRPSIQASKSDYYTHAHDLPPQLGGCNSETGGLDAREHIDGGAWKFPLQNDLIEPDWGWISSAKARRQAAERMIYNPEKIARFAARGAAPQGFPPVWAELADPNAAPAVEWIPSIDLFFRHATALLLAGYAEAADSGDDTSPERAEAWESAQKSVASIPSSSRGQLAACLEYLQRRIGVPRDMSLPAARRLRAELGKLIDALRA